MKEIINLIPLKYRKWYFFGLFFVVMGQISMFGVSLVSGKTPPLLIVFTSDFATNYILGQLSAQLLTHFAGGVLLYWWEIGRKKQ